MRDAVIPAIASSFCILRFRQQQPSNSGLVDAQNEIWGGAPCTLRCRILPETSLSEGRARQNERKDPIRRNAQLVPSSKC
jgi:hypothetical protein